MVFGREPASAVIKYHFFIKQFEADLLHSKCVCPREWDPLVTFCRPRRVQTATLAKGPQHSIGMRCDGDGRFMGQPSLEDVCAGCLALLLTQSQEVP